MADRTERARRIRLVQKQLHDVEEVRLADLHRQLSELEATRRGLMDALNGDCVWHGLFTDTLAKRVRSIAEEAERIGRKKDAQALYVLERAVMAKCAEKHSAKLDQHEIRLRERALLLDVIDRLSGIQA